MTEHNSPPSNFRKMLGDSLFPDMPEDRRDIFTRVAGFYERAYKVAGTSSRSVLWPSRLGQRARFKLLARIFGPEVKSTPVSVNDYGCGYGELFRYLDRKWRFKLGAYYGYDICAAFLDNAQKRITDPRATFIQSDKVTETADYTICSGTFGLKFDFDHEAWTAIAKHSLVDAAGKTRRGLAFNMIDISCPERDGSLYRADAGEFEAFCKEHISPDVEVVRDRVAHEWTMLVRMA